MAQMCDNTYSFRLDLVLRFFLSVSVAILLRFAYFARVFSLSMMMLLPPPPNATGHCRLGC